MNEGSGTVAHDLSGGGHDGAIAGSGPTWVSYHNIAVSLQGGTLTGSGVIATDLTNAAQVNVGGTNASGSLVVTGNYIQTAAGALNIEVGGVTAGSQFDQLEVDGTATLAGALNVSLINSFQPSSGQSFEIETFDAHLGSFATINGLPPGLIANYTSSDLLLISQIVGITVTPTFGLVTTEGGGTTTFSVVLDGQPTSDVFIDLESDNEAEGTISTRTLHFTTQNWDVPQVVTVTGVDDAIQDGDVVYHIILRKAVSGDPSYNGFDPSDVTLTNRDDDHAGFTVTPTSGLETTESGGQASYTIVLKSQPLANVSVALSSTAPSEGMVTPLALTFTPQNWNQAQTVTVKGVDDQVVDGDVAYKVQATATSADPLYNQVKLPDVSVVNHDNDTRDLQISNLMLAPSSGLQSGNTVVAQWTVSNIGNLAASVAFNDLIVVKNLTTGQTLFSTAVTYDPTVSGNGPIAAGESRQRQFSFQLPDGTAGVGQIQVTATVNYQRSVVESDTTGTNNIASVTESSTIASYPDLQVGGLTLGGVSLQPSAGVSGLFDHNLIVDGNAEAGNTGNPFPGWTVTGSPDLLLYSAGTPSTTDPGPADRGANFFAGGQNNALSSLAQTVDLTPAGTTIDTGTAHFALGAYLGGYSSQDDAATLTAQFFAADGTVLGSTTIGPVTAADRADATGLLARTATDAVPIGARQVLLTLSMARQGGSYNDGYADDLSFALYTNSATSGLQSGDLVVAKWNDINSGNGPTSGTWQDHVVVRNTATGQILISQNVPYDPSVVGNGNIEAGGSRARQMAFTLPDGAAGVGDIEVTVTADGGNNIFEFNGAGTAETNNSAVATVTSSVASYPDLVVTNISVDPPSAVTSGSSVTIHWNDANTSTKTTPVGWTDKVVIQNTTTGETLATLLVPYDPTATGNGNIDPGTARARQVSYQLPDGTRGIGQITVTVTVDNDNVVVENNSVGTAETNNTGSLTFASVSAPYADLQVANISIDPSAGLKSGGSFVVHWDDSNIGTKATAVGWTDLIVIKNLTTGETLASVAVPYDPTQTGNGSIAAGTSRSRQYTGKLPDGVRGIGQIQVTITTDINNNVLEFNSSGTGETNNTSTATVTSIVNAYPDLQAANLLVEAPNGLQSGNSVVLHWDDRNAGTGVTSGSWYDYVTIKNVTTGETLDTIPVAYAESIGGNGPIAAGDARARQLSYMLPIGLRGTGQIQFTVTTDNFNQIFEFNTAGSGGSNTAESNNTTSVTVTSLTAPAPDLQVANLALTPPSGLRSGDGAVLNWDVQNTGNAAVTGSFYSHVVVRNVTTNQVIASGDVFYDPAVAGNGSIGAGATRSQQFAFTLPAGSPGAGQLELTVTTDFYSQIGEFNTAGANSSSTAETNNSATTTASSALAPYADLATSAVTAPSLTVGDPATVTIGWTVTNAESAATTVGNWTDAIIVSSDADPTHGTVIGQLDHVGALSAGATYQASLSITLPPKYQTHSHLFVRTDSNNVVFENNVEANNYAEASNLFDVTPAPFADLVVSNLVVPQTADSSGPLTVSWSIINQFPHAIGTTDSSTWSDTVALASDPLGKNIVATLGSFDHVGALQVGGSYDRTGTSRIPDGLHGTFYVVVRTGGPSEFIYTDNDVAISGPVTINLTPPPDLVPGTVVATTPGSTAQISTANAGDEIDVNWTVQNAGGGPTNGTWYDSIFLQEVGGTNRTISLGAFDYTGPLGGGLSYSRSEVVQLPTNVAGIFQVMIKTNAGLFPIYEAGASGNNTLADPNTLTLIVPPNPDLQVFSVDSAPTTANAGGTVALDFTVINQGIAEAKGHWKDNVYISLVDHLDGSAVLIGSFDNLSALQPGEKYQISTGAMLVPKRLGGPAYLIVDTDANNALDELPNTDNNTFVQPITINPEPPADLVTGNVEAPDQTFDGTTITVSYHVDNLGLEPTDQTNWTDEIWLTRDKTRPNVTKGDVLLATVSHSGIIGNDPSVITLPTGYDVTTTVTLPEHISGQFYVTAWSDAFDVVHKSTQDININPDDPNRSNNDNYKARPITVLLTPPPDLVVTAVTPQATGIGGDDFTVNWTVQNQGTSPTENAVLFDQVYLSDTPNFVPPDSGKDIGNQWFLGSVEHDGIVSSNGSYTNQATFHLTPEISGKYVIVVANTGQYPIDPTWEGQYTDNNIGVGNTRVTPRPLADLRVTSVVAPAINYSGESTTVSWTVQNFGADAWSGTRYWTDDVYFSRYATFDSSQVTFIGHYAHSNDQPLASGASYSQTATFNLPKGIGGTAADPQPYYVYVITDPTGDTSAHSRSNSDARDSFTIRGYEDISNNRGSGVLPVIYREPDLQVTNLVVPTDTPSSGQIIPITWTVSNLGNRDTREGRWTDSVFISLDPSLDAHDIEIGELSHNSILATGSSYTASINARLPDGIGGNFYILVYTDSTAFGTIDVSNAASTVASLQIRDGMGNVPEFQGEGNNITAAFMPVSMAPPPDLQVTSVVAQGPDPLQLDHVLTGQSFTLTYTVTNAGSGATPDRQGKWDDYVYLSRDQFLSDADVYLGAEEHTGGLAAGAGYQNTMTFKAPKNLTGPWYVFVITDPPTATSPITGVVFEAGKENNNATATATPLLIDQPPPADLVVDTITIPTAAMSGDTVHLSWTVDNIGTNAASGSWRDIAYLSSDNTWDIGDKPIGFFDFSGTLIPGGSYTATLTAQLPPATPGTYRIIVRTDIFDDIVELPTNNNTTTSASVIQVTVPELHLDVPLDTTLDTGQDRLFQVTVPQGQTLQVDLTSTDTTAANTLFLRYGALPTGSQYDASYQGAVQASQVAVIPSTTVGTYYVLVHGQSEPAPGSRVTLLAHLLPFGITDVVQDQGGDSRYVTTTIYGAQFDPQAIVKLVRSGFAEYEPVSYQVIDPTRIIAIFDLRNAPHGLYDVEVINPNDLEAIAPYRYLVEEALPADVSIALGGPRVIWAGQSGLYGFTLTSQTNVDIPYVEFQYGVPGTPLNEGVPYLGVTTNVTGTPDVADVPWASIVPISDTTGQSLTTGYAYDLADRANTTFSFQVQTYPNGLPPGNQSEQPGVTAFAFNIMGAATALTPDEYVAQQKQLAATLRTSILNDPTASSALQNLAADAASWTDLYLTALTQAGLLRPVDQPPEIHENPVLVSLQATLAAGILAGPAGKQIITNGNLLQFFSQVQQWYGNDPTKTTPYQTIKEDTVSPHEPTAYVSFDPSPASDFDLNAASPTHYESNYVYVPWANSWDFPETGHVNDQTHPENQNFINVQAPNFASFFNGSGRTGQAFLDGPLGYGTDQFVPQGTAEPYTIQFQNAPHASSTVGEIRIVTQLDSNFDPRSFRLGDLQIGNIQVHVPTGVGSFQSDFDFTQSKGYILRASAGIDLSSNTLTWLLQAIDPLTGEVIQDPTKGLLPPDDSQGDGRGFVSYTATPKAGLPTGTQFSAQARVLFNTTAPLDTQQLTFTLDSVAPVTTLTAKPLVQGGSDYQVQWSSQDDSGGSGVKDVTVYVSADGGGYSVWLKQTTDTSGIYNGQAGHTYKFLALATDNAGNVEQPPSDAAVPNSDNSANLGATPTLSSTSPDLGTPPAPSAQPSTNALFVQAQQGIPSSIVQSHASEFTTVLAPFTGEAFATGIAESGAGIGPMAVLVMPDGSVLVSGGASRNQLFKFSSEGGQAGTPLATLPEPIYDLALDTSRNAIWAATGGGPLYELDATTGAVLAQFGDSLTQALAIQPGTGLIYVSSGNGIEVFDPTTQAFSHFSDIRVGSLAFAPDGTLWAVTWPHNQGQIIAFTGTPLKPELMLSFDADVDSIAFGQAGSALDGLLFVSHTEESSPGAGTVLSMVDLATMKVVDIAKGGTRGDIVRTSADGRVFLSQSHQVDVLGPVRAPLRREHQSTAGCIRVAAICQRHGDVRRRYACRRGIRSALCAQPWQLRTPRRWRWTDPDSGDRLRQEHADGGAEL